MAVAQGYGKIVTSGSVFAYDVADTRNSYIGEPTTNLALFSVISGITFNADYGGTITQTADYVTTYKGRPSLKVVSTSQWNIYKYPRSGNYTATSSTVFTFSWKMKWSDGRVPVISNGYIRTDAQGFFPGVTVTAIEDGWYLCQCNTSGTNSPLRLTGFYCSQTGTCYITDWQAEAKSHATPFTPAGTTRSATQGLLPLVGNSTIDLTNMSFDSNAQIVFDGTNDYIDTTQTASTLGIYDAPYTMESVFKITNTLRGDNMVFGTTQTAPRQGLHNGVRGGSIYLAHYAADMAAGSVSLGEMVHILWVYNGTTAFIYKNGVLQGSSNIASFIGTTNIQVGRCWAYFQGGEIPVAKIYNRALSAGEVRQNYLHYKTRFNLS